MSWSSKSIMNYGQQVSMVQSYSDYANLDPVLLVQLQSVNERLCCLLWHAIVAQDVVYLRFLGLWLLFHFSSFTRLFHILMFLLCDTSKVGAEAHGD